MSANNEGLVTLASLTKGDFIKLLEEYIRENWPGGYPGEKAAECSILRGDDDCRYIHKRNEEKYCGNCKIWHRLRREAEAMYGRRVQ